MTEFERVIGRLLIGVTYVAGALLAVGVLLMAVGAISPLSGGPRFDPAAIPGDIAHLDPSGFLWLGLLAVIATPLIRVVAAAIAFARAGDRQLVAVAVAILGVVAAAIGTSLAVG